MAGGEDLRDGAAGVVGDQIDPGESEGLAEVLEARGQRGQGQVLPGGHRAAAVQGEVHCDAPAPASRADDVAP